MSLPPHFLDELRDRVTVSSVVGRKYKLERKGREFLAVCPFHNDTKPSLSIVDDKGFYHCFACGAHGDVFKFLMENDGLKFMEAVEQVAALAGVEVPKESPEEQQRAERRRSLQEVVDLACRWYERQLHTAAGEAGLRYLKERGLTDETLKTFRLGWAPDDRKALQRAMKAEGVETDVLVEAGLVKRYDEGERAGETVDYMRGRVLFPITDRRGKVIAFGGRVLGDGQPKYLNSPDTPLFHKGRVLYGLAQAREPAHKSGELLVAEGYMDVIALAQAGFPAVAPLGTALTEDQIVELWRITPEPILCFDGDTAGQRAARRACDRALPLLKPGHSLRFVTLPEGQDPDDLIKRDGKKALRDILATARGLADFLWASELSAADLSTPERRAEFKQNINSKIKDIADKDVQEEYWSFFRQKKSQFFDNVNRASRDFRKSPRELNTPLADMYIRGHRDGRKGRPIDPIVLYAKKHGDYILHKIIEVRQKLKSSPTDIRREKLIISIIAAHPSLLDEFGEVIGYENFTDPVSEDARHTILDFTREYPEYTVDSLRNFLKGNFYNDITPDKNTRRTFPFCDEDYDVKSAGRALSILLMKDRIEKIEREIDSLVESVGQDLDEDTLQVIMALRADKVRLINEIHAVDPDEMEAAIAVAV